MIWDKVTDPHARMVRALEKLFKTREAQFWGSLGLTMGIVADDTIDTMATDAINIYYSPAYVMTLTEAECMGVIAHEISHPALRHFARQGNRDTHTWNIAADYELNLDLVKAGLTLPQGALIDQRFDKLTAEQIFNVVSRENSEDERNGQQPRHQSQSGDMRQPTHEDGTPMSGDETSELDQQWQAKVSQVLGAARKAGMMAGGHIPTSLVAISETIRQSNMIDWRQPLRAFIDNLGSRQTSWARLSRRGMSHSMALPAAKVIRPSLIAFIVDVSGSMDRVKVSQALIEAQAALDDQACDAIDVIYTDTSVKSVDHYETGDQIAFHDANGGGTDFRAVMEYVHNRNGDDYAAIVFLTDGQTSHWGDEPDCPVLWAITDTIPATKRLQPPYGDKLCLYAS